MLRQLNEPGVENLTKLLSLTTIIVPDDWKMGRMVPLLKPDKDTSGVDSYRPISLSPVTKKIEHKIVFSNNWKLIKNPC